jgi:diguanylate cyclase (GGDEF)-like protein/PAS domain S-box-containing protein
MTPDISPALLYALSVNSAVSLIIGLALLVTWRHHRGQRFICDIGLAHLVQVFIPLAGLAEASSHQAWQAAGTATIVFAQVVYTGLMVLGIARLSRWAVLRREWLVLSLLMSLAGVAALVSGQEVLVATLAPIFNTLVGAVATRRLWHHVTAERWVGPLLLVLGATQLAPLLYPDAGLLWQLSLGTVLRVALGLALVYATLERSTEATRGLRGRLQHLVEHSHQGMLVRDGDELLYANAAVLAIFGHARQQDLQLDASERILPPQELARLRGYYQRLNDGWTDKLEWEGMRLRHDGTSMWLRFSAWPTQWAGRKAIQVLVTDETAQHGAAHALLHRAMHDELTGLPNRAALLQRLRERCVNDSAGGPFALVVLGIDRFKLFNEAHGHSLGDEVLKALAGVLRRELGSDIQVMRIGADEFGWTVASPSAAEPQALAARVQQVLRQPIVLLHNRFFIIDASMGIALCPAHARGAESLLRAATAAMHVAKRTPGTAIALADPNFARGSIDRLEQEQALRTAIQQRQFRLHYQPKVDAATGRLVGFEALARWHRPGIGWVGPQDFIATAERNGLIAELGELLLRQACVQVQTWRDAFDKVVPVAVNVSPLQMLDGGFPKLVKRLLDECGLPPQAITLELTESAALSNPALAREQIMELSRFGVEVALDDFGTGFSSLNMLRRLPVHTIKIDRGLITPLPAADATAVVRAICQLAAALGLKVVAEGVENPLQAEAARKAGCEALQGDWFAQALPPREAARWLSESVTRTMPTT